jgi:excisionase family DNA binding protein
MTSSPEPLLTLEQVSAHLQISPRSVQRHVAEGHIPVVRIGRLLRFRPADVELYVRKAVQLP